MVVNEQFDLTEFGHIRGAGSSAEVLGYELVAHTDAEYRDGTLVQVIA